MTATASLEDYPLMGLGVKNSFAGLHAIYLYDLYGF